MLNTVAKPVEQIIEYANPLDLKYAPFNPPSRTEKRALIKLRMDIEKRKKIIVPLLVTSDNFVADGHRRLTIALELGFDRVPIIRENESLAELWGLNGTQMSVTKKTWMQAVREGYPLEFVPDEERNLIEELIRIVGKKLFEQLSDNRRSPYIGQNAKAVAGYCGDTSDKFIKQVVIWFEEHETQAIARQAMGAKCPPEVLASAINERRPIRQYWGVS
jgi:ParB-like nuclease family protein